MEDRQIQIVESRAVAVAPLDSLATMSDTEFEQRLVGLKTAQARMVRIQREIMQPEVDYGVIPGTGSKPTLLKPGAEKLCKFYRLVPIFRQDTIIGDGVISPHIRILSTCSLHLETEDGPIVAQGIGSANSWEKKYRYREAQRKCPSCDVAAIRRSKYPDRRTGEYGWYCHDKVGGCGAQFHADDAAIISQRLGQVENPDPYDTENTLEKMSAKRAQVDATLRATATSGLFTQDVEDMDIAEAKPAVKAPEQPRPEPARTVPPKTTPISGRKENDPKLQERWASLWQEAKALGLQPATLQFPCTDSVMIERGKELAALIENEKNRRHAEASIEEADF